MFRVTSAEEIGSAVRCCGFKFTTLEAYNAGAGGTYAGDHAGWELVAKHNDPTPPQDIKRDKDGLPLLSVGRQTAFVMPDVCVGITLGLITETRGYRLDDLANRMGTARVGDDSDEELQEQLMRQLYGRGPEQALEFLKALTRAFRRDYYPDHDRDMKAGKGLRRLPNIDIGQVPKAVIVR
jgi:hypothetical protein